MSKSENIIKYNVIIILISVAGFMAFLDSNQMNIKDPKTNKVYQDMTQPLSHYFVASSHNT